MIIDKNALCLFPIGVCKITFFLLYVQIFILLFFVQLNRMLGFYAKYSFVSVSFSIVFLKIHVYIAV